MKKMNSKNSNTPPTEAAASGECVKKQLWMNRPFQPFSVLPISMQLRAHSDDSPLRRLQAGWPLFFLFVLFLCKSGTADVLDGWKDVFFCV